MSERMPTGFLAHGSPLRALDAEKGADLRRWGSALPTPQAILVVSAHWERAPLTIGTVRGGAELVYDFGGFPRALYEMQYPAPGAPQLAEDLGGRLADLGAVREDRGLDHGVWVPLVHMFPDADVPVLQLSMPRSMGYDALFALGERLQPLRDEGVLILGSGNLTHNLRELGQQTTPTWAADFDAWAEDAIRRRDWDALQDPGRAPGFTRSHPRDEHYRPMLVAAGAGPDDEVSFPVEGFELGSISRRSVQLG